MILNEKNDKTKKVIHLLVTSLCDRNCKYCCNKQYDLNDIPQVTEEELSECETVCLTGGEPFAYTQPYAIAHHLKNKYPNIKKVYVYTNAFEMLCHLNTSSPESYDNYELISSIDGYNISLKSYDDVIAFRELAGIPPVTGLPRFLKKSTISYLNKVHLSRSKESLHNRFYIQTNVGAEEVAAALELGFDVIERPWQKEFVPCNDSIFRRI